MFLSKNFAICKHLLQILNENGLLKISSLLLLLRKISENFNIAENIFHNFNVEAEPELLRKAVMEDDRAFEYFGYWNAAAVKTLRIFHLWLKIERPFRLSEQYQMVKKSRRAGPNLSNSEG